MKLTMNLGTRSYPIIIQRGGLKQVSHLTNLTGKVMIVSDEGVPSQYVKALMAQCSHPFCCVLPQGEQSKSVGAWQHVLGEMLKAGFGRGDVVAAVGGGVVGDLAGFVAASYMRGVSFIQFPTTTLSQIDSSIGGKTAINLDGTKNIVGAFHQPSLVLIDPNTLSTLPPRHYSNGLAEALKTALIGEPELFEIMERGSIDEDIERILFLALQYKKGVVERDETEKGERKLLNFGHTIGHGIESACGMGGLLHGECVALGMLPMIENSSLAQRTKAIMKTLSLPEKSQCNAEDILRTIPSDKKRHDDFYTIVRVKTLGEGYLENVTFEEIKSLVYKDLL